MVPILDVKMYIGEDGLIKHQFYEKPCTSKFVIPNHSTHSSKMKKSVLVEDVLRRLWDSSGGLEDEVRVRVMGKWAKKLRRSGYPPTVWHQVIKEAVVQYEKMCEVEDQGGRSVHRAREWQKSARRLEKELKGVTWHQGEKGQKSAPLILDTIAGELTSQLKV